MLARQRKDERLGDAHNRELIVGVANGIDTTVRGRDADTESF
jgi:hypothetical protein